MHFRIFEIVNRRIGFYLELDFIMNLSLELKKKVKRKTVRKKLLPIMANMCCMAGIICVVTSSVKKFRPDLEKERVIRTRSSIFEVLAQLGSPDAIRRAIRMTEDSFWKLVDILFKGDMHNDRKRGIAVGGDLSNPCKLYIGLRMFAGASVYDLAVIFGVHLATIYRSLWYIVDIINDTSTIGIKFPDTLVEQEKIAEGFKKKSWVGFDNCVGCIDGMLVWIDKPTKNSLMETKVGPKKFFCGRKKKFGLNLQAICDDQHRFIDVNVGHTGATSDYLAYSTSDICKKIEGDTDFIKPGYSLYGDSAYCNAQHMTVPFKNVKDGPRDAFNFYHSQVRINIECSFGMLVNKFPVLRKPFSSNINISKVTAIVRCLCILHNFCIDVKESTEPIDISPLDRLVFVQAGFITSTFDVNQSDSNTRENELLHGGEHRDDVPNYIFYADQNADNPREKMLESLINQGYDCRPQPTGSTTTNN